MVILAARATGVAAIDGPAMAIADGAAAQSAAAGFDGKWAIHPSQVDSIIAAFSPSDEDVARARRIIDVLDEAARNARGATSVDGEMVDEAHRAAALRLLARPGGGE